MGGRTSAASHNKYNAKAYDRIGLMVPKGQKDTIKAHAESQGESVNARHSGGYGARQNKIIPHLPALPASPAALFYVLLCFWAASKI